MNSPGARPLTWASMVDLGREGYLKYANAIFDTAYKMQDVVRQHPELNILGDPSFCFSFNADEFNIYHVNDFMRERGWRFNGQQNPDAIHMCVTRPQTSAEVLQSFASDLEQAIGYAQENRDKAPASQAVYGSMPKEFQPMVSDALTELMDAQQGLPPEDVHPS